jgi:hypothetical protein
MNVTPEIVKAEMNYRVERAIEDAQRYRVRAAGRAHRNWFRRSREQQEDPRPSAVKGAPRVA